MHAYCRESRLGALSNFFFPFILIKARQINCSQLCTNSFLSANCGFLNRQEALSPVSLCKLIFKHWRKCSLSGNPDSRLLMRRSCCQWSCLTLWGCWEKAGKASGGDESTVKASTWQVLPEHHWPGITWALMGKITTHNLDIIWYDLESKQHGQNSLFLKNPSSPTT